jgi:hypothetical protein
VDRSRAATACGCAAVGEYSLIGLPGRLTGFTARGCGFLPDAVPSGGSGGNTSAPANPFCSL